MKVPWWIPAGLVLVAGISLWRSCAGDQDLQTWRKRAQDALQQAESLQRQSDSLRGIEASLRAREAKIRLRVDTLRLKAETLLIQGDTSGAVPILVEGLTSCRQALALADTTLGTCAQRASLERHRGDSLQAVLQAGLRITKPRRWGCTGGVGAVIGSGSSALGLGLVCGRQF